MLGLGCNAGNVTVPFTLFRVKKIQIFRKTHRKEVDRYGIMIFRRHRLKLSICSRAKKSGLFIKSNSLYHTDVCLKLFQKGENTVHNLSLSYQVSSCRIRRSKRDTQREREREKGEMEKSNSRCRLFRLCV
jgi:hypothetical protein